MACLKFIKDFRFLKSIDGCNGTQIGEVGEVEHGQN